MLHPWWTFDRNRTVRLFREVITEERMILALTTILAPAVIIAIGLLWFGMPYVARLSQVSRMARRCRREGLVALTYDDGPSDELTDRLVDLLAELDIGATFFMTGETIVRQEERVRRHLSEGHEQVSERSLRSMQKEARASRKASEELLIGR